ncbi:hypothetical protein CDL12_25215 [Handroanthus impetiginosus]|uniref:TCP domain-containing protein n=1 Tax=Handroanthus impetiginosus TaxID=429701 RepID=A0A2G9GAH0_9LAMI|nr:hypothetical protein CDL12_25215 [Handroanthus impetiginosus]
MIQREAEFSKKSDDAKITKAASSSSSPTTWSRLKDPRVVRVSRSFGGKDRHSKVCTVRGLRDRRVRLSVPTAIQLYDLQDRLGFNQPSKVVDWLLNAAKNEIDELPPLQIPQGFFSQHGLNPHEFIDSQSKDVLETSEGQRQYNLENDDQSGFVSTNVVRWDPSNLSLSYPPQRVGFSTPPQNEDLHNFSRLVQLPSVMSHVPSGSHQVFICQPYFPSQTGATNMEFDPKQSNFQSSELSNSTLTLPLDSTSQHLRPFHFKEQNKQNS